MVLELSLNRIISEIAAKPAIIPTKFEAIPELVGKVDVT